jgi:hypothetical protein
VGMHVRRCWCMGNTSVVDLWLWRWLGWHWGAARSGVWVVLDFLFQFWCRLRVLWRFDALIFR